MAAAAPFLQWGVGIALVALGVVAVREAILRRSAVYTRLAVSVGALGAVALAGRIQSALPQRSWVLGDVALIAFMVSGYALLLLRDSFLPLSARARRMSFGVVVASTLFGIAVRLPHDPLVQLRGAERAAVLLLVGIWFACVAEPAWRFHVVAGRRHGVERSRLRALTGGYVFIAGILFAALLVGPVVNKPAWNFTIALLSVLLVPLLYVALIPPRWIRRRWRAPEERGLRVAIEGLLTSEQDRDVFSAEAIRWGVGLLGGVGGVLVDGGGRILGMYGVSGATARTIAHAAIDIEAPTIMVLELPKGLQSVAAVPLRAPSVRAVLVVLAGPFTPMFAEEELQTLSHYGAAVASAIDRSNLLSRLRFQNERHEMLLRAMSDLGEGFVIGTEDRITFVNDRYITMTGYSEDELLSLGSWAELIAEEERAHAVEQVAARLRGDVTAEPFEVTFVTKGGARVRLEVSSKPISIDGQAFGLAVCRDVTDRARALERERRRAKQLEALAGVGSRLRADLEIDALCEEIARAAREVIGADHAVLEVFDGSGRPSSVFEAGDAPTSLVPLMRVPIARGGEPFGQIVLAGKDGEFDDIDRAVGGGLAAIAAESLQVAEAFERERELVRRLREADEMKNAFLSAVSHELRTPLTTVVGFAATLAEAGPRLSEDERVELTKRLVVNARKLNSLLGDLLDLDRLRRGIIQPLRRPIAVDALITQVVEGSDAARGRRIDVRLSPVVADIDGPKVERIVENLLSNAIRHTVHGVPIWVTLDAREEGIEIVVADAGPGVPEDLRSEIFEPFKQAEVQRHSPGVGIGLSLVGRFAELHGGRAWVQDRDGGGAEFHVWLPCRTETPVEVPNVLAG